MATNVLSPKPPSQVPPYPRRTFTTSLIIGIMCVHSAWSVVSQLPQRLDARILKVNMLHIIQYVSFPYWSYIERQLRGDKLSLDIDDLNEDGTEQIRKQRRPVGTSRQPAQGFDLLDACNNPRVFAAQDLAQMSVVELRTLCAAHKLSTSGTKAQFQERILQKQKHIQPPSSTPSPTSWQARVQLVLSSIDDFPHLQPRVNYFGEDFWPQERSGIMEDNVHLLGCAWLSCSAVQCLLEVLLPQGNCSVKPVIQDVTLAVLMQHAPTSRVVYTLGHALPVLLTSQHSTVGVHYVLVTDISIVNNTLVIHDPEDHASTCGAWFRAIMSKMGWSFTWHHYGTQPDSDTCGFCVVMLAMQWGQTNRLTGQLPGWFSTYCASVLQLFADDTSSLRSTVNTFQDWAYEGALTEYDEPVDWAMTEAGPLPTVTNSDIEAATHSHQYMASSLSNSASGPSSTSNDPLPPHPSTRKKCGTSKGTTGATPQTTPPQTTPTRKIPKSRKTNMPPRTQICEPPPYRSHRQPPPKSGQEADQTSRKHSSKKRSSNSESGPRSKKSRPEDHEESNTRRKRSTSSRPSESTSQEPPTTKQRQQKARVNHATLSEKEIKMWLILITDDNLSRRQHREHALHFLGAADSTLVTLQYRTLSLQLHPDKNPSHALAKQRFQVLGCARDIPR